MLVKRIFAALLLLAVAVGHTVGMGLQYRQTHVALHTTKQGLAAAQTANEELEKKYSEVWEDLEHLPKEQQQGLTDYKEWSEWHSELVELLA